MKLKLCVALLFALVTASSFASDRLTGAEAAQLILRYAGYGVHVGVSSHCDRCAVDLSDTHVEGQPSLFMRIEGLLPLRWSTYVVIREVSKVRVAAKLWPGCDQVLQLGDWMSTSSGKYFEESLICLKTSAEDKTTTVAINRRAGSSLIFDCTF